MTGDGARLHLVDTYAAANQVLRDATTFSSQHADATHPLLSARDGTSHTRVRAALHEALSSGVLGELAPRLARLCGSLAAALPREQSVDLIEAYLRPVGRCSVATVLGIDGDDVGRSANEAFLRAHVAREDRPAPDVIRRMLASGLDLETDLLPHLKMLVQAGDGTMIDLIGNTLSDLLGDQRAWAAAVADRALIGAALEASLRARAPLPFVERRATRDCTVGAVAIAEGDVVVVAIGSANRCADRAERPHLSFGAGAHSCLGAAFVRAVGRAAIGALADQAPGAQLVPDGTPRDRSALVDRGLASLVVTLPANPTDPL